MMLQGLPTMLKPVLCGQMPDEYSCLFRNFRTADAVEKLFSHISCCTLWLESLKLRGSLDDLTADSFYEIILVL